MVALDGTQSEECRAARQVSLLQESLQLLTGIAQFHALPHQDKRLHAVVNHLGSLPNLVLVEVGVRLIAADEVSLRGLVVHHACLGILCKVEHYRPWASALGNVESPSHSPCHILRTANLIAPLRDRRSDTHHIHLLEGIRTQHGNTHLTADDHNRCGVNHRIGNTRNRIRCPWTTGHNGTTHLSADTGITLCGMYGSLLVANKDVVQRLLVIIKCIVCRHDAATRIAKEHIHVLVLQGTHQRLCTSNSFHLFNHSYAALVGR